MNQIHGEKHVETEAKIHVEDLAVIEQRLQAHGAVRSVERLYERNVRYEDAANSFTAADRTLRLRQDNRVRLTYKEPAQRLDNGLLSRTELEITVSDFETADLLLQKLGYHPAWIYEKYRTTYEWLDCEIVLDELPFGLFVEVEGTTDAIEQVLTRIGLADAKRIQHSYSDLFFALKTKVGLSFQDLTFENFKDIHLPEAIFEIPA